MNEQVNVIVDSTTEEISVIVTEVPNVVNVTISQGAGGGTWGTITGDIADQTDLQDALDNKAASVHSHSLSDVTGLVSELSLKSDVTHIHDDRYYTETETDTLLSGKAATSHNHNDIYYTKTEIDAIYGDIASALNTINGEVI
jgi:hypothetical protein